MSKPILMKEGLGYIVTWEDDERYKDVTMKFHHFLDDRGDPRPEVKIEVTGRPGTEFDSRINLNSPTSRKAAVNRCADSGIDLPWGTIIDDACSAVRDARREGEPAQDLSKLDLSEASRFAVEPFLLQNQANLFYGNGGLGKSWVSLYFSLLMASGSTHQGFSPEPGRVLYLDYESDVQDMNGRFKALCRGLSISEPRFDYRRMTQSIPGDSERLLELVDQHDIKLVIVDSAAPGAGGKPEEASTAISFFEALRAMNVTTLTIGHISKNVADDQATSTPFGSIFWRNEPRNIWEIQQGETYTKLVKEFGLYQTKYNSGAGADPIGLRFTFDDPNFARNVHVERIEISDNAQLATRLVWSKKIQLVIEEARKVDTVRPFKGVTIADIANAYGIPEGDTSAISKNLSLGKSKNFFRSVSHGRWDIISEIDKDEEAALAEARKAYRTPYKD